MNASSKAKRISALLLMTAIILPSLATPAYGKLTGAIWTTDINGDKVNGNIYENKLPSPEGEGLTPIVGQ